MKITDNFDRAEFEIDGPFPDDCLNIVTKLCKDILEPIRTKFGAVTITSGYRPVDVNIAVHGAKQSQHEYTPIQCAADWRVHTDPNITNGIKLRDVFDWIRTKSNLPVDQLILEHGPNGDIIHTSCTLTPRHEALEGLTGNRAGYVSWRYLFNA